MAAMPTTTIPRLAEEIDAGWLDQALRSRGHLQNAKVVEASATLLDAGVGFVGKVARIKASYDRPDTGLPSSFIAKIPTDFANIREMMRPFRVYEREIRFYEEVAPLIQLRTPKLWYSAMDLEDDRYILIIEDFAGARVGDQLAGCTPEEARTLMVELAKFHAAWWENPKLKQFEWMPAVNDPLQKAGIGTYEASLPGLLETFSDLLTPEFREWTRVYPFNDIQDALFAAPHTIEHADFRLDNMFFDLPDTPGGIAIIDWQASTRGSGMQDVGYFLTQSLTVEDRRKYEDELLRAYHETLREQGVKDYSWDDIQRDYRWGALFGWIIPVFLAGSLDISSERGFNLAKALITRSATAIEDLDARRLLR